MTKSIELPDPSQIPDADVVVYDGKCKFCLRQVARLHAWDGKQRLSFLSLHDERVHSLCPDVTHEELMQQMYVVTRQGKVLGGAAAFRYLARRLPKLWLFLPFLYIPFSLPLWQWIYAQVASRRYKMGRFEDDCEDGTCSIHFDKKP